MLNGRAQGRRANTTPTKQKNGHGDSHAFMSQLRDHVRRLAVLEAHAVRRRLLLDVALQRPRVVDVVRELFEEIIRAAA